MAIKNSFDSFNMRKAIEEFPQQFKIDLSSTLKKTLKPERVIITGLGGSALAANLLQMLLVEKKILLPLSINRDYHLPYFSNKKTLHIFISYSGNTEETLSSFKEALEKDLPSLVVSSGGRLKELAKKNNIPFFQIPQGYQPRMALGYQFALLTKILYKYQLLKEVTSITDLEKTLKVYSLEKKGQELAKGLKNKIPLIYTSNKLRSLARIWKIKFNENSKVAAFFNYFPELNHNEMVAYTNLLKQNQNFKVIILRDKAEEKNILKRMELTATIIREKKIAVEFIDLKGKNLLEKIFSSLLLSDWTSYYLALNQKLDPTPVKIVELFKKKLKETK